MRAMCGMLGRFPCEMTCDDWQLLAREYKNIPDNSHPEIRIIITQQDDMRKTLAEPTHPIGVWLRLRFWFSCKVFVFLTSRPPCLTAALTLTPTHDITTTTPAGLVCLHMLQQPPTHVIPGEGCREQARRVRPCETHSGPLLQHARQQGGGALDGVKSQSSAAGRGRGGEGGISPTPCHPTPAPHQHYPTPPGTHNPIPAPHSLSLVSCVRQPERSQRDLELMRLELPELSWSHGQQDVGGNIAGGQRHACARPPFAHMHGVHTCRCSGSHGSHE